MVPLAATRAAEVRPSVTGRDPRPTRATEGGDGGAAEETFLIERIPVRFVVVILVLPSEGSALSGRSWGGRQPASSRASRKVEWSG